jgi:Zn-dependent peptidase ImmA (M78 family)
MIPRFDFARQMARRYLRKYRVIRPPVEVEVILFEEDVRVETVAYPNETAGESWWEEGVAHIAVNRHHPRARQRFTLAHEFGHLAMRHHEHPARDLSFLNQRHRDPEVIAWEPADPMEVEANQFATELLMPAALFRKDWERYGSTRRLAARYEVSEEAALRRIRALMGGAPETEKRPAQRAPARKSAKARKGL